MTDDFLISTLEAKNYVLIGETSGLCIMVNVIHGLTLLKSKYL